MIAPVISEESITRCICKRSFFEFTKEMWDTIIPEKPIWNWHIELMCDELQDIAERVFLGLAAEYDLVCNVPPGTTKSTIFSAMFAPWTWTRMPSARHLVSTHTADLGYDLSRKSRDIIRSDKYQTLFPEIKIRDDQDTKGYFQLEQGGFRLCATVGGKNPMGFHAHFLTTDDPIDPEKAKAMSGADIKTANNYVTETLPSRKVDKVISVQMLVMQRLAQNDPTGHLLQKEAERKLKNKRGDDEQKPIRHICLPAELDSEVLEKGIVSPPRLKKKYVNGLLDPVRLPKRVLKDMMANGTYFYSCQYRQTPVPLGGGMFRTSKLKSLLRAPGKKVIKSTVRYWDKAGTEEGDGAYTAGVKICKVLDKAIQDEPFFVILDVIRGRWEAAERERIIRQTALLDGKDVIIAMEQEPGSGGKDSVVASIKGLAGYRVRKDKVTGSKAWRADPFAVQVNEGNVWYVVADWNSDIIQEFSFFPFSTYKDQTDAAAGAFAYLTRKSKVGAAF